jgi:hypothetical protein
MLADKGLIVQNISRDGEAGNPPDDGCRKP